MTYNDISPVIILGMRRSGTSVLWKSVQMASSAESHFEPHELWFAISCAGMSRYSRNQHVVDILHRFQMFCQGGANRGFKYVFNPGVRSMEWQLIPHMYPNARFIFAKRDVRETYESYYEIDKNSVRGIVPFDIYYYFWNRFYESVHHFIDRNSARCALVNYQEFCDDPSLSLGQVWPLLNQPDTPAPHLFRFVRGNRRQHETVA